MTLIIYYHDNDNNYNHNDIGIYVNNGNGDDDNSDDVFECKNYECDQDYNFLMATTTTFE